MDFKNNIQVLWCILYGNLLQLTTEELFCLLLPKKAIRDLSCNVKDPFGTLAFIVYLIIMESVLAANAPVHLSEVVVN